MDHMVQNMDHSEFGTKLLRKKRTCCFKLNQSTSKKKLIAGTQFTNKKINLIFNASTFFMSPLPA